MLTALLLVLAGVGAGLTGSVAGLASLVSYPALLAAGLPPVAANVTNTVALVASSTGSVSGSRPELRGQTRRVLRLAVVAIAGGGVGAALLLTGSPGTFEKVVPFLIGLGSLAILLRPAARAVAVPEPLTRDSRAVVAGIFVIGVYGGYFGAAAGVLLLALLLITSLDTLARSNAVKNAVLGAANLTAAIVYALLAPVVWSSVLPLAVGLFAGARLGPVLVRRSPPRPLRAVIALAGLGLAVALGLEAF